MKKRNQHAKKLSLRKETIAALHHIKGGLMDGATSRPTLTWVCQPPKPDPQPTIIQASNQSHCFQTCGPESCATTCQIY